MHGHLVVCWHAASSSVRSLEKHGYEVITAHKGEKAIEIVDNDPEISLIIMDIDLGKGIDGTEAAERILSRHELPIVFLTSHSEKEYVDRVKEITNYGYVLKNSGEFVLIETINMAFNLYETNRELQRQKDNLQNAIFNQEKTKEAYQRIFDLTPALICVAGIDGYFKELNPEWEKTLGYTIEELKSRPLKDFIYPDDVEPTQREIEKQIQGGKTANFTNRYLHKNGTYRYLEWNAKPSEQGHLYSSARDITAQKLAEDALKKSKDKHQALVDYSPFGIIEIDEDGYIISVNKKTAESLGLEPDKVAGINMRNVMSENKFKRYKDLSLKAIRENKIQDFQLEENHKFFHHIIIPMYYGERPSVQIISEDITELKEAEEKLRESEKRYRTIVENINDALIIHDFDGIITFLNDNTCKMLNYTQDELIGKSLIDLHAHVHRGLIQEIIQHYSWQDRLLFEIELIDKGGNVILVEVNTKMVSREGFGEIQTVIIDMTERKKSEKLLLQREEQYRFIYNSLRDALIIVDTNRKITDCNTAFTELFGYTLSEVKGKTTAILFASKDDYEQIGRMMQDQNEDSDSIYQPLYRTKSGETFWGEKKIQYLKDDNGNSKGFIGIIRDITKRKKAENKLREAIKEKDFLMKELNHRVKNNLNMVSSLINLKDSETEADFSDIKHQIEAIGLIHEKLYQTERVIEIDCRNYFDDLLNSIFSSFTTRQVRIEKDIEDICVSTKTAMSLGLIINEIATNAIKYGLNDNEEPVFSIKMKKDKENNEYELILSNTGNPFPEKIDIESTETLGLRLINALVSQIDGIIELQKTPNPVFNIRFPVEEE